MPALPAHNTCNGVMLFSEDQQGGSDGMMLFQKTTRRKYH